MAITQEQVNEVCNSIADAGGTPTLIKVREALGSGSMATIAKMVREWKGAGEAENTAAPVSATPENIQAMAAKMWAEAQRIAAMQYEAQRAEMAAQVEAAEQALETAYAEWSAEKAQMMQIHKTAFENMDGTIEAQRQQIALLVTERESAYRAASVAEAVQMASQQEARRYAELAQQLAKSLESIKARPAPSQAQPKTKGKQATGKKQVPTVDQDKTADTKTLPLSI